MLFCSLFLYHFTCLISFLGNRRQDYCTLLGFINRSNWNVIYFPFSRFWLIAQRRQDGQFDIVIAHIARREEFDFFQNLARIIGGSAHVMASAPPKISDLLARLSQRAYNYALGGILGGDEDNEPPLPPESIRPPAQTLSASQNNDLSQAMGDRLTEYEMVEDLIERGMLGENENGTLYIRL